MAFFKQLEAELNNIDNNFSKIIRLIPPDSSIEDKPYWLHFEMLERFKVLSELSIIEGNNILEVGCGSHAIATVPLAYMVGEIGRVVAIDINRWHSVEEIVNNTGFQKRVIPLKCDARELPFPYKCFDKALITHGIRNMRSEENIIQILHEMFRVSSEIIVFETLPIGSTKAQEAHLEMYNLREDIYKAHSGVKDDIHYLSLEKLCELIGSAGGKVKKSFKLEVKLPHFLATIPKQLIEKINNEELKKELLEKWEKAHLKIQKYGEEHPPVGVIIAE